MQSTYSFIRIYTIFTLIILFRLLFRFLFINISTRLLAPSIYYILQSLYFLYNYYSNIILIIKRFSLVVLSLTKYLQSEYKSIQIIILIFSKLSLSIIIFNIRLIVYTISTPKTILYILDIRILLITLLYFIKEQQTILPLIQKLSKSRSSSLSIIRYPS